MPDREAHPTVTLIVRALVTLALLAFAFLIDDAPSMPPLIVGAVVGYWLREGEGRARRRLIASQAIRDPRAPRGDDGGGPS